VALAFAIALADEAMHRVTGSDCSIHGLARGRAPGRWNGRLAAVAEFVVVTHIVGCRPRLRLPIDIGDV
jgi:hypothetical protein